MTLSSRRRVSVDRCGEEHRARCVTKDCRHKGLTLKSEGSNRLKKQKESIVGRVLTYTYFDRPACLLPSQRFSGSCEHALAEAISRTPQDLLAASKVRARESSEKAARHARKLASVADAPGVNVLGKE